MAHQRKQAAVQAASKSNSFSILSNNTGLSMSLFSGTTRSWLFCSILLVLTIGCDFHGPLLAHRIIDRNPKYSLKLEVWDSPMAFGSGTSRLTIKRRNSIFNTVELNGTGRFSEIYWKDINNLIVIDLEGSRSLEKHRVRKFKYGDLTITNICFIENGGTLVKFLCDSLSLENGQLLFFSSRLVQSSKLVSSVPIDQFILTYSIDGNTVEFEALPSKSVDSILDYRIISVRYSVSLSDSNLYKLRKMMTVKMS